MVASVGCQRRYKLDVAEAEYAKLLFVLDRFDLGALLELQEEHLALCVVIHVHELYSRFKALDVCFGEGKSLLGHRHYCLFRSTFTCDALDRFRLVVEPCLAFKTLGVANPFRHRPQLPPHSPRHAFQIRPTLLAPHRSTTVTIRRDWYRNCFARNAFGSFRLVVVVELASQFMRIRTLTI